MERVRRSAVVDDFDQGQVELLRWDRVCRFWRSPSGFVCLFGVAVGKVHVAFREMLALFSLCHVLIKTSKTRCLVDHEHGLDVLLVKVLTYILWRFCGKD